MLRWHLSIKRDTIRPIAFIIDMVVESNAGIRTHLFQKGKGAGDLIKTERNVIILDV